MDFGRHVKITHVFASGNDVVVEWPEPESIAEGISVNAKWECFPPSEADFLEYQDVVLPTKILPALEATVARLFPRRMCISKRVQ